MSSEQLIGMSDLELLNFADNVLGIHIPLGTLRNTVITRIVNSAVSGQ